MIRSFSCSIGWVRVRYRIPATRDARSVRADAVAVIEHLKGGGKWTAVWCCLRLGRVKDRTYFCDEITVDGQPADTHERHAIVCVHLDLAFAFNALELAWSDHRGLPSGSQLRIRVAAIEEHVRNLNFALNYAKVCQDDMGRYLSAARPVIPET